MNGLFGDVVGTLTVTGVLGCLGYLRSLAKSMKSYEEKQFRDELHLLDHEQRLKAMETHGRTHQ